MSTTTSTTAAEVKPAPAHKVTPSASANRRAAAQARSAAVKGAAKPTTKKAPAKAAKATTSKRSTPAKAASKPAAAKATAKKATSTKVPTVRKPGRMSQHIEDAFKGLKRGAFLSVTEIVNHRSPAYPGDELRPTGGTVNKAIASVGTLPKGVEPATGPSPRNAEKAVKGLRKA